MAIVNGSLQEGYKDAAWFAANPTLVLLVGQKVNLEQTGTYKLGDGTTQLSALSFLGGSGSGLSGLTTNKVLKATSSTTAGDSNITDDGTNVVVNGLKIRSISNATYFNASGVNGHYWNSFDDAINLFRVKNDGVVNIPQGTSDRIMALDTNKDVVYLSTTVYPSLTELSYGKGVTSAIQTQLDGKANNLLAKQNTTITHTGTTAETKIYSALIPAGSVQANDVLKLLMKAFGASGVASKSFRMYFNTSDAIGGVQVGINTIAATSSTVTTRNIFCKNSLSSQQVLAPTNSFAFEETVTQNSGGYSTISINFAVDQYFIVSCQLTTGTESASILGLTLQAER